MLFHCFLAMTWLHGRHVESFPILQHSLQNKNWKRNVLHNIQLQHWIKHLRAHSIGISGSQLTANYQLKRVWAAHGSPAGGSRKALGSKAWECSGCVIIFKLTMIFHRSHQSIIYLPEKNNTSRTQRLQNNTNKCPKNPKINYIKCSFWKAYVWT